MTRAAVVALSTAFARAVAHGGGFISEFSTNSG